ncbi:hypothetical protein K438DRAFT_1971337 [Mycena galopus ATCC 62051]|nr:hypothetical protein K438DRAFT_1971337 [Mycena galopus ATCC 62051]
MANRAPKCSAHSTVLFLFFAFGVGVLFNRVLMIHAAIRRVDAEQHASVDFSDFRASWDYFFHLFSKRFWIRTVPSVDALRLQNQEQRAQTHAIVREASETVHEIFVVVKDPFARILSVDAVLCIARAELRQMFNIRAAAIKSRKTRNLQLHVEKMRAIPKDAGRAPRVLGPLRDVGNLVDVAISCGGFSTRPSRATEEGDSPPFGSMAATVPVETLSPHKEKVHVAFSVQYDRSV